MSDSVIAKGVVQLTADGGPMTSAISAALANIKKPLADVKSAGESAAGDLGSSFSKAGAMIAGGLAVGALGAVAFAVKSAGAFKDYGESVLQMQRQTGLSAQAVSQLMFAASQTGVSAGQLSMALKKLSQDVTSIAGTTNAGAKALNQYNIATVDATGKALPLNQVLLNVADAFANGVIPASQKGAVAVALFGRSGTSMLEFLNLGKAGLQALEAETSKYGLLLTQNNLVAVQKATDAQRQQTAAWQGLQVQIGENVLPVMTKLTEAFTQGLLVAMPLVSRVVSDTAVPAFSALAAVVSGTTGFISHHTTAVEYSAAIIGTVMVPALVAWGVAQAKIAVSSAVTFVSQIGAGALDAAVSIGLLADADNYLTVTLTDMGIAAGAAALGIGLIVIQNRQMQDSANKAAQGIVDSASSQQQAITELTAKQAEYRQEMNAGVDVLGLHITLTDGEAKAAAEASKGYAAVTAQLANLRQAQVATATSSSQASDAITAALSTEGLKIQALGGATKLTDDQIQALADSMNIDLTKATSAQIDKLTTQAVSLGYASSASLRLATDTQTLADWTQDATKKTQAFKDATDALITSQTSAEGAAINFQQSLADLAAKLTGVKYSTDLTTQAGRDQQTAIMNAVDATQKQIEAEQQSGMTLDELRPKMAQNVADLDAVLSHAGLTAAQIQQLNAQYNLTPAALAEITPAVQGLTSAVDGQTSAWNGLTGSIAAAIGQYNQAVASGNAAAAAAVGASGALNKVIGPVLGRTAAATSAPAVQWGHPRAAGGPVAPGVTYPVGEKGPELFTPTTPGTIIPADLSKGLAGLMAAGSRPAVHNYDYSTNVALSVEGSVTAEADLVNTIRTSINRYNARAGGRR